MSAANTCIIYCVGAKKKKKDRLSRKNGKFKTSRCREARIVALWRPDERGREREKKKKGGEFSSRAAARFSMRRDGRERTNKNFARAKTSCSAVLNAG